MFDSSQKCMWDCFVALQSLLSPYLTILEQRYHVHLHPFYLQYLHPTVQYVYRQYLIFLNTPVMVEVLAYLDFLTRKMHVLFYRIEMDLPRYYHSMSRFLSIVSNRMIWSTDRLLNKLASSLSRSPICNIFGPDEWYLIINIGIIAGIGLLVFALRRLIYSLIRWILRVIISPFQYLVMLIFRKRPNSIPQANSNSS